MTNGLQERWEGLSTQISKTLDAPDSDAVHNLRVATRRLEQALAIFATGKKVAGLQQKLKALRSAAGDVRDCDIAAHCIGKSRLRDFPAIDAALRARRTLTERTLVQALQDWKMGDAPRAKAAPQSRAELDRRTRAFLRSGDQASKDPTLRHLHKLRIAAKKLRYTLELYGDGNMRDLPDLQRKLGRINDLRTARKIVKKLGGDRKLDAALKKRQQKKAAAFHHAALPPGKPAASERRATAAPSRVG